MYMAMDTADFVLQVGLSQSRT